MPARSYWGSTKPPAGTPLDWGHPLVPKLIAGFPFLEGSGEGTWDAANPSRESFTPAAPGLTWSGGPYRTSPVFNGSSDALILGGGQPNTNRIRTLVSQFSVVVGCRPASITGIQRYTATQALISNTVGWGFGQNGANLEFSAFGVADVDTATSPIVLGQDQVFAMNLGAAVRFYKNGQFISGGTLATPNAAADLWLIGSTTQGLTATRQDFFNGRMSFLYIFNHPLTAFEHTSIAAEPFQMYAAPFWRSIWVEVPDFSTRDLAGDQPASTGVLTRVKNAPRALAGNQPNSTAVLTRVKQALRALAGNQPAWTGVLTRVLQAFRALAGNQPAWTGVLAGARILFRTLVGDQPASTGILTRVQQALRSLAGNQPASTGVLNRLLQALRTLAGNQPAPTGVLTYVSSAFFTVAAKTILAPIRRFILQLFGRPFQVESQARAFNVTSLSRTMVVEAPARVFTVLAPPWINPSTQGSVASRQR